LFWALPCNNAQVFDWNDGRYFLAIARGRSLSAAGRSLQVQQSTVGRRLGALEAALGVRLFDRTPDGYLLTQSGEALLTHAERMEDEALSAERTLLGRDGQIAGVVRLTAPPAFGNAFVTPLLARLKVEQPEILVELVADSANLSLTKREADLALRLGRPRQPLLVIRRLGDVATGLYASRDYLASRGRPRGPDLSGHDYVDYDETYPQKEAIAWYRQCARGGRCTLRVNGTHGLAAAVQAGMGVGPLPCWLGDATAGLERLFPTTVRADGLWLVLHRDLRHVARVRTVADFLGREMRRQAPLLLGRTRPPRARGS
jgi:DNA-binding transcriptional LysR family regulator